MEKELKKRIADSTKRICGEYRAIVALLSPMSASNQVLQQYLEWARSALQYAEVHYQDASSIDLAVCKQRHDPARLLSEVGSRFYAKEQGFYHVYPDAQFKARLNAHFEVAGDSFDVLEDCLSAI